MLYRQKKKNTHTLPGSDRASSHSGRKLSSGGLNDVNSTSNMQKHMTSTDQNSALHQHLFFAAVAEVQKALGVWSTVRQRPVQNSASRNRANKLMNPFVTDLSCLSSRFRCTHVSKQIPNRPTEEMAKAHEGVAKAHDTLVPSKRML